MLSQHGSLKRIRTEVFSRVLSRQTQPRGNFGKASQLWASRSVQERGSDSVIQQQWRSYEFFRVDQNLGVCTEFRGKAPRS